MSDAGGVKSRLTENATFYAIALGFQRAIGFLMLPVYTRFLSPGDYGVLQLLEMTTDVAAIAFTAGLSGGVQRLYFRAESETGKNAVLSTALIAEVLFGLVGAVLLIVFAEQVHQVVLSGAGSPTLIRLSAANFLLGLLSAVPLMLIQAQHKARAYSSLMLLKLATQVSLNLFFIVGMGQGVRGILLSTLITSALVGGGLAFWMLRHTGFRLDGSVFRQLFRFGLPAQVATAASFILGFGDRFFLQASHGESTVGLYGLAYQFGFLLMQFSVVPCLQAWNPYRFETATGNVRVRDRENAQGFYYLNLVLIFVAVGIAAFVRPVLDFVTPAAYHEAFRIVPLILLAYIFHGWTLTLSFSIDYSGRTEFHAIAAWIAAIIVLAAYAILVPPLSAFGAAIATVIGLGTRLLLVATFGRRLFPIRYGWARVLRLMIPATIAVGALYLVQRGTVLHDVAAATCITAAFAIAVWVTQLATEEREAVSSRLRSSVTLRTLFARR